MTLLVGGAAGTTTNCMANTNPTITFWVMDLNQQFNAIVTLTNAGLDSSSEITLSKSLTPMATFFYPFVYVAGSYDVQSIAVDSPAPNAVTLNASYLENSPAMGVVFVLLFTDDAGSVNFTKSLYLVLDRVESSNFLQNNVTQGRYDVLAFDVEEDGRLWSSSAEQETVTVGGEGIVTKQWSNMTIHDSIFTGLPPFPYPPVPAVTSCSTFLNGTDLTVSCDFNNGSVLGYYVLVQFAEDLMLLTGETQDGYPVEFEDLPANGVYSVVVFPLTENGIIGTAVAFTEQVSPDSTEPPAPTTTVFTSTTSKSQETDGGPPFEGLETGAIAAIAGESINNLYVALHEL